MSGTRDRRRAGNLPVDVTSFMGRRRDLAEVKRLLSSSRLVTLAGVGGVGKTRLALRAAADLQRAFPDGVWLVDLAALEDPGLLAQTVAGALGIQDQSARWLVSTLSDQLGDKQLLLAVPPLSAPEPDQPIPPAEALGLYEAVTPFRRTRGRGTARLHADRRERSRGRPALPAPRRDPAGDRAGGGTAAHAVGWPDPRAAARPLPFAGDGPACDAAAQQTLRALIDWSFDLCTPEERVLWARVSVFAGGFDLEAAEAVCSGDGIVRDAVLDLVTGLVDKSVLVTREGSWCGTACSRRSGSTAWSG